MHRTEQRIKCPSCGGFGRTNALVNRGDVCTWENVSCATCKGHGWITGEQVERRDKGEAMRRARLDRDETQREAAQRLGISVVTYSQAERGLVEDFDYSQPEV